MAAALYIGGGTGSYVANTEMQQETAEFRYEIKQELKQMNKTLEDHLKDHDEPIRQV